MFLGIRNLLVEQCWESWVFEALIDAHAISFPWNSLGSSSCDQWGPAESSSLSHYQTYGPSFWASTPLILSWPDLRRFDIKYIYAFFILRQNQTCGPDSLGFLYPELINISMHFDLIYRVVVLLIFTWNGRLMLLSYGKNYKQWSN